MGARSFATLHAGLIARKGDAVPTEPVANAAPPKKRATAEDLPPVAVVRPPEEPPKPSSSDQQVRVSVPMSASQKRLLVMLKTVHGKPYTDIIDSALNAYFQSLAEGELRNCACFRRGVAAAQNERDPKPS